MNISKAKHTHIAGLDKKTIYTVLASSGVLLLWSFISSLYAWGPTSASIISYGLYLFYWFYALKYKNPLVLRLIIFGTIAGILELVTDHYLVETIKSLVYPQQEQMIWNSPAYMPIAWSNILFQLGFIGVLLTQKKNLVVATIVLAIAGGMYIPLYEHLAKDAGWWWYNANTKMVFNAPLYVIVCESLISLSLPVLIYHSINNGVKKTILYGLIEGGWIFISAFIGYAIAH